MPMPWSALSGSHWYCKPAILDLDEDFPRGTMTDMLTDIKGGVACKMGDSRSSSSMDRAADASADESSALAQDDDGPGVAATTTAPLSSSSPLSPVAMPIGTPIPGRVAPFGGTIPSLSGTCTPVVEYRNADACSIMLSGGSAYNLDTKSTWSETNSAILPICRICHLTGDEADILISPCRCSGTLLFIHNTCLMRWLEITTKKSRKPPKCELCRYQYHRHKKFKFNHWRFPRVSSQDKVLHVIFIFNLIVMIGCAIATVMCFLSDKEQINVPRNKAELSKEEIITLSCGVLFFVSFFIAMSVQIKAKHTVYQLFIKFIMQNMQWEIDEYDKSKDAMYASALNSNSSRGGATAASKEDYKGPPVYV